MSAPPAELSADSPDAPLPAQTAAECPVGALPQRPASAHPQRAVGTTPCPPVGATSCRPDTPCVAVCSTTFDDICRGCGRTVVEVAHWVSMSHDQKEAVWQRILAQGYPRRKG